MVDGKWIRRFVCRLPGFIRKCGNRLGEVRAHWSVYYLKLTPHFSFFLVRTILLALRDHFTVEDKAAIGYLDYPSKSRQELALKSQSWKCKGCPYDASQHFDTEASGAKRQRHVNENNNSNLLWNIGVILLIFSILFSYVYIYLI